MKHDYYSYTSNVLKVSGVYGKYVNFDIWVYLLWDPPIIFLNLVILKINIQGETSLRADFVSFRLFTLHQLRYLYLT